VGHLKGHAIGVTSNQCYRSSFSSSCSCSSEATADCLRLPATKVGGDLRRHSLSDDVKVRRRKRRESEFTFALRVKISETARKLLLWLVSMLAPLPTLFLPPMLVHCGFGSAVQTSISNSFSLFLCSSSSFAGGKKDFRNPLFRARTHPPPPGSPPSLECSENCSTLENLGAKEREERRVRRVSERDHRAITGRTGGHNGPTAMPAAAAMTVAAAAAVDGALRRATRRRRR
jgi:hypothetical protein